MTLILFFYPLLNPIKHLHQYNKNQPQTNINYYYVQLADNKTIGACL